MKPDGVSILGMATALPSNVRGNDFWPDMFKKRGRELAPANMLAIERSTRGEDITPRPEISEAMMALGDDPWHGARERRVIEDGVEPSDLEARAARAALARAGLRPDDIDLVLVTSLTPDRLWPSNAPAIQNKCKLVNASAWSMDVACASFQAQYVAASSLIRAGIHRHVLCVFSGFPSRVLDYAEGWSINFGDGAAAMVMGAGSADRGLLGYWSRTDGAFRDSVVHCPIEGGVAHLDWMAHVGPIRLASPDVAGGKQAGLRSTEFCHEASMGALAAAGLGIHDVDFFIANQSVGWLVDACRRVLGIAPERTIDTFAEVGNIGPAVIPYHLERAWHEGLLHDGSVVLIYSPGAGLTRSAVVLRWCPPRHRPSHSPI